MVKEGSRSDVAPIEEVSSQRSRAESTTFDYTLDYDQIDFRKQPECYQIGRGEQGVLLVEPYKSELLPLWRFRTPEVARESAGALLAMFEGYRENRDFVGMDMTRKFLQMGFTRARRYANHRSGRKWSADRSEVLPRNVDGEKAASAAIFYEAYVTAREVPVYQSMKARHLQRYGNRSCRDPKEGSDAGLE